MSSPAFQLYLDGTYENPKTGEGMMHRSQMQNRQRLVDIVRSLQDRMEPSPWGYDAEADRRLASFKASKHRLGEFPGDPFEIQGLPK